MINKALKLIRNYHNKALTDTATELGVSKSHVSEIERGNKTPSFGLLERYSEVFDLPLSSILFFAENYDKDESERAKKIRKSIAGKAIKILEWVEEVS